MTDKHTFPPGKYVVGDPCYCFTSETWKEFAKVTNRFNDTGAIDFKGSKVFWGKVAHGDGRYPCYETNVEFPVDSATLGVVPWELVDTDVTIDLTIIETVNPLHVSMTERCTLIVEEFYIIPTDTKDDEIGYEETDSDEDWNDDDDYDTEEQLDA